MIYFRVILCQKAFEPKFEHDRFTRGNDIEAHETLANLVLEQLSVVRDWATQLILIADLLRFATHKCAYNYAHNITDAEFSSKGHIYGDDRPRFLRDKEKRQFELYDHYLNVIRPGLRPLLPDVWSEWKMAEDDGTRHALLQTAYTSIMKGEARCGYADEADDEIPPKALLIAEERFRGRMDVYVDMCRRRKTQSEPHKLYMLKNDPGAPYNPRHGKFLYRGRTPLVNPIHFTRVRPSTPTPPDDEEGIPDLTQEEILRLPKRLFGRVDRILLYDKYYGQNVALRKCALIMTKSIISNLEADLGPRDCIVQVLSTVIENLRAEYSRKTRADAPPPANYRKVQYRDQVGSPTAPSSISSVLRPPRDAQPKKRTVKFTDETPGSTPRMTVPSHVNIPTEGIINAATLRKRREATETQTTRKSRLDNYHEPRIMRASSVPRNRRERTPERRRDRSPSVPRVDRQKELDKVRLHTRARSASRTRCLGVVPKEILADSAAEGPPPLSDRPPLPEPPLPNPAEAIDDYILKKATKIGGPGNLPPTTCAQDFVSVCPGKSEVFAQRLEFILTSLEDALRLYENRTAYRLPEPLQLKVWLYMPKHYYRDDGQYPYVDRRTVLRDRYLAYGAAIAQACLDSKTFKPTEFFRHRHPDNMPEALKVFVRCASVVIDFTVDDLLVLLYEREERPEDDFDPYPMDEPCKRVAEKLFGKLPRVQPPAPRKAAGRASILKEKVAQSQTPAPGKPAPVPQEKRKPLVGMGRGLTLKTEDEAPTPGLRMSDTRQVHYTAEERLNVELTGNPNGVPEYNFGVLLRETGLAEETSGGLRIKTSESGVQTGPTFDGPLGSTIPGFRPAEQGTPFLTTEPPVSTCNVSTVVQAPLETLPAAAQVLTRQVVNAAIEEMRGTGAMKPIARPVRPPPGLEDITAALAPLTVDTDDDAISVASSYVMPDNDDARSTTSSFALIDEEGREIPKKETTPTKKRGRANTSPPDTPAKKHSPGASPADDTGP